MSPQILESPDMIINPYRFAAASSIPSPTHYSVMDGTGNAIDTGATGGEDFTENGTVTEVTGKSGNGRSGFTTANYFSNAALGPLTTGADVYSVHFWVNVNTSADHYVIGWTSAYFLFRTGGNELSWNDGTTILTHSVTLDPAIWYSVAFGYSADGKRWATVNNGTPTTLVDASVGGSGSLLIGKWSTLSMDGIVDELSYWDGADIRGAALTELYNSGTGKFWNGTSWS